MADPIERGSFLRDMNFLSDAIGAEMYGEKDGQPWRLKVGEPNGLAHLDGSANVMGGGERLTYKRAGVGAIERTILSRLLQLEVTPEEYGAVGDGVADDYLPITRAIAVAQANGAGWAVKFNAPTYAYGTPLVLQNVPVELRGHGGKHPAYNGAPAANGSTLKYIGPAGQTAITVRHVIGKHGIKGINIDCNNLAAIGLDVADAYYGDYADVSVRNNTLTSVRTGLSAAGSTNWNTFDRFSVDAIGAGKSGLHLTGTGTENTAHNQFRDWQINHGDGGVGIRLGYSDNNTFNGIFINRISGAGEGVLVVPGEEPLYPTFPESNYFYHLQAGPGGWVQPANASLNYVFGYDRSNGQPLPVLNGSTLIFCEGQNFWIGAQKLVKDADAWSTYVPTVAPNSGAITTLGARSGRYLVRGKMVYFHVNVAITANGTGAGYIDVGLPPGLIPGGTAGFSYMAHGRAIGGAGAIMGTINQGSATIAVQTYNGGYPGANGVTLTLSGHYEIN